MSTPGTAALPHLVLLGAGLELLALGVQLGEVAGDLLHAGVQRAVLPVFCIEVVLVALSLGRGRHGRIFTEKPERAEAQISSALP